MSKLKIAFLFLFLSFRQELPLCFAQHQNSSEFLVSSNAIPRRRGAMLLVAIEHWLVLFRTLVCHALGALHMQPLATLSDQGDLLVTVALRVRGVTNGIAFAALPTSLHATEDFMSSDDTNTEDSFMALLRGMNKP
jgi:hypothetical protein